MGGGAELAGTTLTRTSSALRLLLNILVLDGDDTLPLLGNTGSATLAGSLLRDIRTRLTGWMGVTERTLFLTRRASIWSERILVRFFSALALWMYSIRTRLFLKTLPFDFW